MHGKLPNDVTVPMTRKKSASIQESVTQCKSDVKIARLRFLLQACQAPLEQRQSFLTNQSRNGKKRGPFGLTLVRNMRV